MRGRDRESGGEKDFLIPGSPGLSLEILAVCSINFSTAKTRKLE